MLGKHGGMFSIKCLFLIKLIGNLSKRIIHIFMMHQKSNLVKQRKHVALVATNQLVDVHKFNKVGSKT